MTSPVDDASATIRLTCPKRVLSWWWSMSTESGTRPSTSGSAIRLSFAQSTASRTRSATSSGQRRCSSASSMKAYSPGSGASPTRTITASFPSWSSASFVASSDPSASPSGFSCVVMTKRSWLRIASATAASSLAVVWCEFIDQFRHADPALDRRIVCELELRGSLQPQLACDLRLKDGMCGLQGGERPFLLPLRTQHRDEHARLTQIRRCLDTCHGDEADPGVLELPDMFGKDLPDRFVHAAHALAHPPYSSASRSLGRYSTLTTSRSARTSSNSCPDRYRSASSSNCSASRYSRVTHDIVRRARCQSSWWSTSATETPKRFWSCAFADLTNFRLPLSEPASGKCSSTLRIPT